MYGTFPYAGDPFGDAPIGGTTAYPLTLDVTRAVLEVIGSNDQRDLTVQRLVVEVIGEDTYLPGDSEQVVSRLAVEVIHSLAEQAGTLTQVSRAVLEVIGSAAFLGRGMYTPWVGLQRPTIFVAWNSGFGRNYYGGPTGGLSMSADGATITIRYTDGTRVASATALDTGALRVVAFSAGTGPSTSRIWLDGTPLTVSATAGSWDYTDFGHLNMERDPLVPEAGSISELMVFGSPPSEAQITYLRQYFECKWLNPGCIPQTDLPPAP